MWNPLDADGNLEPQTNFAPQTQNLPMPRLDLEIDGGSKNYDVGYYFTCPDGDALSDNWWAGGAGVGFGLGALLADDSGGSGRDSCAGGGWTGLRDRYQGMVGFPRHS